MWRTTTLVSLLLIFFTINQSFSAIFWYFQSKLYIDDYANSREASVHRGLFLSYSTVQKKLLCEDHFSAQLYIVPKSTNVDVSANELITDGQETEGESQYNLIVSDISLTDDENGEVVKKNEIFIKCFGTKFENRIPYTSGQYFLSYGFQNGRWLASTGLAAHGLEYIVLGHNISSSPQNVPMEPIKLEQQYVTTREVMEELRYESPTYVRLIEDQDYLSSMTIWQRAVLCASVLSSPIYREERLEYSTKWISDHANDLVFVEKQLPFTYNNRKGKKSAFICDCIICKGFTNGDDEKSKSTDLCLTRSYDDDKSFYVIRRHKNLNFLDKYFRRMPILTNVQELFKNYNERKAFELSIDD